MGWIVLYLVYAVHLDLRDPPFHFQGSGFYAGFYGVPVVLLALLEAIRRTSRWKVRFVSLGMRTGTMPVLALVLLIGLGGEVYFRLASPVDVNLARRYKPVYFLLRTPGARYRYYGQFREKTSIDSLVEMNSESFHDREREIEKPAGTLRVVVLGDSMVQAIQVHRDEIFFNVVEDRWRRAGRRPPLEAIGIGREAIGQHREAWLLEEYGFRYDPDVVVCAFFSNDVDDTWLEQTLPHDVQGTSPSRRSIEDLPAFVWQKSLTIGIYLELDFATWLLAKMQPSGTTTAAAPVRDDAEFSERIEHCLDVLESMRDRCRERGARFLVFGIGFYPSRVLIAHRRCVEEGIPGCSHDEETLGPNWPEFFQSAIRTDVRMMSGLSKRGIENLFFSEELPAVEEAFDGLERDPLHLSFVGDFHWNAEGHAVAGRILESRLARMIEETEDGRDGAD